MEPQKQNDNQSQGNELTDNANLDYQKEVVNSQPQPSPVGADRQETVSITAGIYPAVPESGGRSPDQYNSQQQTPPLPKTNKRRKIMVIVGVALALVAGAYLVLFGLKNSNGFVMKPVSSNYDEPAQSGDSNDTDLSPVEIKPEQLKSIDNPCYTADLPGGFVRDADEEALRKNRGIQNQGEMSVVDQCRQFLASKEQEVGGSLESIADFSSQNFGKFEDLLQSLSIAEPSISKQVRQVDVGGNRGIYVTYRYDTELSKNLQRTRVYVWNDKKQKFSDESTYKYWIFEILIKRPKTADADKVVMDEFLNSLRWK